MCIRDSNTANAAQNLRNLQSVIDRIHGKTVTILTRSVMSASQAPTPMHHAAGGPIVGPGTGTSDSIPLMGSNGEFMVNAKSTAQNMGALSFINSGGQIPGYAGGGPIISMPRGYDTGGMMMPGGVGRNYGNKPERVMSGSQTEWFEAGRAAAGGGSGSGRDVSAAAFSAAGIEQAVQRGMEGATLVLQVDGRSLHATNVRVSQRYGARLGGAR